MISIKNLSKSYTLDNGVKVEALKNINHEVEDGEILGVIGESGSGKTSLLRILRGVEKFDEGEFTLGRYTVKPDSSQFYYNQVKKETAIHLQRSFGIWPETALDNVVRKLYGAKYGDDIPIIHFENTTVLHLSKALPAHSPVPPLRARWSSACSGL